MYMNIMSPRSILILIKSRKKTLLIHKLMVVFDVLPINDNISFGAVAVNDLTHPKQTLCDKALVFVYTPNVFPDKK